MTRSVNLYALSRIRDESAFNLVEKHASGDRGGADTGYHEIESLRLLTDALVRAGVRVRELDGFFLGYTIPRIGKEFDLLKLSDTACLNIELKSAAVPEEQILRQLLTNRYYLSHLGRELRLYTVVTSSLSCFRLDGERLKPVPLSEVAARVRGLADAAPPAIDALFRVSEYLVSPLGTPEKFLRGQYFLTQAQDQIKRALLRGMDDPGAGAYYHLTGSSGTGKTLLLYDLAKTLSEKGDTLLVHCGELTDAHRVLSRGIPGLAILPDSALSPDPASLASYRYILADEAQRMEAARFEALAAAAREGTVCVFSTDPGQILTAEEERAAIPERIRALPGCREFVLSERIRANREISGFIECLRDLRRRPDVPPSGESVELCYANTTREAVELLAYYKERGFVFLNYARSFPVRSPYGELEGAFDASRVIGREFDRVVMLMDGSFAYDADGVLQGVPQPAPGARIPNLFYQGLTRVREQLALIVTDAPQLFERVAGILRG